MGDIPEILRELKDLGQEHILEHYIGLNEEKRSSLLRNISIFDFRTLFSTYSEYRRKKKVFSQSSISPPAVLTQDEMERNKEVVKSAYKVGESVIREGKVACLLVAGGKATRLGLNAPKGFYEIGPLSKKSFFQIFSEKILALSNRFGREIPFLIMTNPEDSKSVRDFFEAHRFFGLRSPVIIFEQDLLPCLTLEGKLILKNDVELITSPNGHGNSLKKLCDTGLIDELSDMGIEFIFYFQVDNPLVKICDPLFLGFHKIEGAEVSLKVVRRKSPEEKAGTLIKKDGKTVIVEYMELDPKALESKDESGREIFWALNTGIHVFTLSFLKEKESNIKNLPYHVVERKISLQGTSEEFRVVKFETFVFDSFEYARKIFAMEVLREEEFSPVKEVHGSSTPSSAQEAMSSLFKKWVEGCSGRVKDGVRVEVSPLFALDFEEFREKMKGRKLIIEEDTYFGEV